MAPKEAQRQTRSTARRPARSRSSSPRLDQEQQSSQAKDTGSRAPGGVREEKKQQPQQPLQVPIVVPQVAVQQPPLNMPQDQQPQDPIDLLMKKAKFLKDRLSHYDGKQSFTQYLRLVDAAFETIDVTDDATKVQLMMPFIPSDYKSSFIDLPHNTTWDAFKRQLCDAIDDDITPSTLDSALSQVILRPGDKPALHVRKFVQTIVDHLRIPKAEIKRELYNHLFFSSIADEEERMMVRKHYDGSQSWEELMSYLKSQRDLMRTHRPSKAFRKASIQNIRWQDEYDDDTDEEDRPLSLAAAAGQRKSRSDRLHADQTKEIMALTEGLASVTEGIANMTAQFTSKVDALGTKVDKVVNAQKQKPTSNGRNGRANGKQDGGLHPRDTGTCGNYYRTLKGNMAKCWGLHPHGACNKVPSAATPSGYTLSMQQPYMPQPMPAQPGPAATTPSPSVAVNDLLSIIRGVATTMTQPLVPHPHVVTQQCVTCGHNTPGGYQSMSYCRGCGPQAHPNTLMQGNGPSAPSPR